MPILAVPNMLNYRDDWHGKFSLEKLVLYCSCVLSQQVAAVALKVLLLLLLWRYRFAHTTCVTSYYYYYYYRHMLIGTRS